MPRPPIRERLALLCDACADGWYWDPDARAAARTTAFLLRFHGWRRLLSGIIRF